jgi:nucleoside-diphosphate-sugar epimerase
MITFIFSSSHSYTQQKFNLLREESEGYSKLLAELTASDSFTEENLPLVVRNIQNLMGEKATP